MGRHASRIKVRLGVTADILVTVRQPSWTKCERAGFVRPCPTHAPRSTPLSPPAPTPDQTCGTLANLVKQEPLEQRYLDSVQVASLDLQPVGKMCPNNGGRMH